MSGNEYVAELRAENERLRETVQRVEALADELGWLVDDEGVEQYARIAHAWTLHRLRKALSAPSPSVEHRYTQTDGQAPAGRYEGAQGAGDGV